MSLKRGLALLAALLVLFLGIRESREPYLWLFIDGHLAIDLGVKALNSHPVKTDKRGEGQLGVALLELLAQIAVVAGQRLLHRRWQAAEPAPLLRALSQQIRQLRFFAALEAGGHSLQQFFLLGAQPAVKSYPSASGIPMLVCRFRHNPLTARMIVWTPESYRSTTSTSL